MCQRHGGSGAFEVEGENFFRIPFYISFWNTDLLSKSMKILTPEMIFAIALIACAFLIILFTVLVPP